MSETIRIVEVGPRDGLQNEAIHITTEQKNMLVETLVDAGLTHIELTSFVHPQAVPQMADADAVMTANRAKYPDIDFTGLVFNQRGYDRALAAGAKAMAFGVAVSETFSQKNTRRTPDEAFRTTRDLIFRAKRDGIWTRAYVMTAWVCPFEGEIPPNETIALTEQLAALGVDELALADTIGFAQPYAVGWLMEELGRRLDMTKLAVHLHDTQAMGLANATTALQAGVRIFDSSVGGLGGCPFAPGAAGNLATEDIVFLADKMGYDTGVDFDRLWDAVYLLQEWVNRPIGGRIRPWWESSLHQEPALQIG